MREVRRFVREEVWSSVLIPLILIDLIFVGLHVGFRLNDRGLIDWFGDPRYSLETDGGLAETFNYGVWLVMIACLAVIGRRDRSRIFIVWIGAFGYLLADDALRFHEVAGEWLGEAVLDRSLLGLGPASIGELGFLGLVGVTILLGVLVAFPGATESAKSLSLRVVAFLGAFSVFGVLVDALHAATLEHLPVSGLALVEDGGEILVLAFLASFLVAQAFPQYGNRSTQFP